MKLETKLAIDEKVNAVLALMGREKAWRDEMPEDLNLADGNALAQLTDLQDNRITAELELMHHLRVIGGVE